MIHKRLKRFKTLLALAAWPVACAWAQSEPSAGTIQDGDRIVFVGDSITGQGARAGKNGWIAMIGEGLALARPEAQPTLIGLGGSGATVGAWHNFEKRSRTGPVALDVKTIDVGQTLDAGAEIMVVMLGMNDVLAPSLRDEPANFDAWLARYAALVETLRTRSHPRVIALATVTPCTEDPASPKNRVLAELNRRLADLAREKHFRLLPTNAAAYEIQALGRADKPDFRVTGDFVHPNRAGHVAIAVGMLRGLGEASAAEKLLAKYSALWQPAAGTLPALSYSLTRQAGSPDDERQRFVVDYQWTAAAEQAAPLVKPALPDGWTATPESLTAAKGRFELTGPLDRARNTITLTATAGRDSREQTIAIPAGWRIASGPGQIRGWTRNSIYDPAQDHQPLDESLANGDGLTTSVSLPKGDPAPWTLYVPSNDYTGLANPGSVDMAAVVFFRHSHQAYGARWIHSDRERPANLNLSTRTFAGMYSLGVWLNGRQTYAGKLRGEPKRKATSAVTLRKGWNLLVFKSTFIQWQWQFAIDLSGQDGDDLDDLRYATRPPANLND
jgi:lysophospholipase L1-like esterase